jgi:hypothetical protein
MKRGDLPVRVEGFGGVRHSTSRVSKTGLHFEGIAYPPVDLGVGIGEEAVLYFA